MPHLGAQELIIGLVIVLVLFASTRLPQLARGLREGPDAFREEVGLPRRPSRPEPFTLADLLRIAALAAVLSAGLLWWAR